MTEENKEEIPIPILIEDLGMEYPTKNSKQKTRFGIYKCGFCGNKFRTQTSSVKSGCTKSCGCYHKKKMTKHGLHKSKLYKTWNNIKSRTLNPKNKRYSDYGGRGINICDEWKNDFMSFHDWAMSNDYTDELSIDRIDNDGNYEPSNCRWVTSTLQSRNRRIRKDNTSGYKGVYFREGSNNFRVLLTVNKKRVNLGYFQTAVEGAIAYNNYIIKNNLEGFILNEIPENI